MTATIFLPAMCRPRRRTSAAGLGTQCVVFVFCVFVCLLFSACSDCLATGGFVLVDTIVVLIHVFSGGWLRQHAHRCDPPVSSHLPHVPGDQPMLSSPLKVCVSAIGSVLLSWSTQQVSLQLGTMMVPVSPPLQQRAAQPLFGHAMTLHIDTAIFRFHGLARVHEPPADTVTMLRLKPSQLQPDVSECSSATRLRSPQSAASSPAGGWLRCTA